MFTKAELSSILFLDLETAPLTACFSQLSQPMQKAWIHESSKIRDIDCPEATPEDKYVRYAGLYAEFGRIVCLSAAYLKFTDNTEPELIIRSVCGPQETDILQEFASMSRNSRQISQLCAHNGRDFDFPFLGKRFLIHGLQLPSYLAMQGKASWEMRHLIDTMHLWKFSVWKEYRRLELLCAVLDIPTSKDDLDGSRVADAFWQEKDYERIARYCEKDVIALVRVMLRMSRLPLVPDAHIIRRPDVFTYEVDKVLGVA